LIFQRTSIALFFFFAAVVIHSGFYTPVAFDNFYFAAIARNIASGHGWVDNYHQDTWFVATSTGPLVLIPGAILIGIFGNEIWVPALASAISNLFWLAIFSLILKRYLNDIKIFLAVMMGVTFVFIYYENYWWTTFVGEIPSFLLFLIGALVALDEKILDKKKYFFLGVIAGLSIYAKMLALPGFGAIAIYLVLKKLAADSLSKKIFFDILRMAGFGLAGMIFILLPFRIYEAFSLYYAGVSYKDFWMYKKSLYGENSSIGISYLFQSENTAGIIAKNFMSGLSNVSLHLKNYGISLYFLIAIFIFNAVSIIFCWWYQKNPLDRLIGILGLSLLFFMLYFFVLIEGVFVRYALQPLMLLFLLTALSALRWLSWKGLVIVVVVLLAMLPSWKLGVMRQLISFQPVYFDEGGNNIKLNQLTLEVNDYIARHDFAYPLASCGWLSAARSVVYLQDETKKLKDCYVMIEEALQYNETEGRYQWREPVNFILVIDNINWRFAKHEASNKARQNAVLSSCRKKVLYESDFFRIMECPFSELQKHIDLDATTPFVGVPRYGLRS